MVHVFVWSQGVNSSPIYTNSKYITYNISTDTATVVSSCSVDIYAQSSKSDYFQINKSNVYIINSSSSKLNSSPVLLNVGTTFGLNSRVGVGGLVVITA